MARDPKIAARAIGLKRALTSLFGFPFAPILLAALVPVWHFALFRDSFPPEDMVRPVIFLVAAFALLLLLVKSITHDWHRAGMWAICPLVVIFAVITSTIILAGLLAAILLAVVVRRGKANAEGTFLLNIIGIIQLSVALYIIGPVLFAANGINLEDSSLSGTKLTQRPSIIHIVLDGYSAREVLSQVYGHDNSGFEKALEKAGFTVMDRAFTPHNQTLFAMASVMNGRYLEAADLPDIADVKLRLRLGKAVTEGAVPKLLKSQGYQFAYTSNGFRPLRFGDGALLVSEPKPAFNSVENSVIAGFRPRSTLATTAHNAQVRSAFAPENYAIPSSPFFYYQHVISPHPPFSLTSEGGDRQTFSPVFSDGSHFVRGSTERRDRYIEGYVEKLKFTNKALLRQLQHLPNGPVVVIVHGDHGGGSMFNQESLENSCALERFSTLFAVYSNIPQVQQAFAELADAPFNLANTYRVLFSALSESAIENLPDTSFYNPWSAPRRLQSVPPDVRGASCSGHPLYRKPISVGPT